MSRNISDLVPMARPTVAPREGRVSRNYFREGSSTLGNVAPREGRVSRNITVDAE